MTDSKELDWNEGTELARCEKVIREGKDTFIAVGEALMTIRDKRLYRATHKDFPAYVKDKCGFGKSRAYQLIAAAREDGVSSSTNGGKSPRNERQSRAKREPAASKPTRKTVVTASDTDGKPTGPGAEFPDSPQQDPPGVEPFHGPVVTVKTREPGEDDKPRKNGAEVWPIKSRKKAGKLLGEFIREVPRDSPEGRQAQPHMDALVQIVEARK